MPQMSPINWLSLFIIFSITFVIFNMMNYYSFNSFMPMQKKIKPQQYSLNWKW